MLSLQIGTVAIAMVIAFKWSTHRIEYRPVEALDFPDEPEEEEIKYDRWGNPIELSDTEKAFRKLDIDEDDE